MTTTVIRPARLAEAIVGERAVEEDGIGVRDAPGGIVDAGVGGVGGAGVGSALRRVRDRRVEPAPRRDRARRVASAGLLARWRSERRALARSGVRARGDELRVALDKPSEGAARLAVRRALERLAGQMSEAATP